MSGSGWLLSSLFGYFCTLGIGFGAAWLLCGRGWFWFFRGGAEVRRLFFVQGIFISWGV
jgi:hypothetical protein